MAEEPATSLLSALALSLLSTPFPLPSHHMCRVEHRPWRLEDPDLNLLTVNFSPLRPSFSSSVKWE